MFMIFFYLFNDNFCGFFQCCGACGAETFLNSRTSNKLFRHRFHGSGAENYLFNEYFTILSLVWRMPGWIKTNFYHHRGIFLMELLLKYSFCFFCYQLPYVFPFFNWQHRAGARARARAEIIILAPNISFFNSIFYKPMPKISSAIHIKAMILSLAFIWIQIGA